MSAIKLLVISVMGLFPPDLMDGKTAPGCGAVKAGRPGQGRAGQGYHFLL